MAYGGVDMVMNDLPVRLSVPAGGKRAVSGIEHLGTLPQREGLMSRYGAALSPSLTGTWAGTALLHARLSAGWGVREQ